MSEREELAQVYADRPRLPLLQLIDHVLELLELRDQAALEPFRAKLRAEGRRADPLVHEHLLDQLVELIDPAGPEQPFAWHVHRALHRQRLHLAPGLTPELKSLVREHKALLERWADEGPPAFLYVGLRAEYLHDDLLAHLAAHASDIQVAAFLGRSAFGERINDEIASLTLNTVLQACLLEAVDGDEPGSRRVPRDTAIPVDARNWARLVLGRANAMALLRFAGPLPLRLEDAKERRIGILRDDESVDVGGTLMSRDEWYLSGEGKLVHNDAQAVALRWQWTAIFHVADLPLPADPDEATQVITELAIAQPSLQAALAERLRRLRGRPNPTLVRNAALVSGRFLQAVVTQRWESDLAGIEALVPLATEIEDADARLDALLAIGAPAVAALEHAVDADVALLATEDGWKAGRRLQKAVKQGAELGLAFWWKRIARPGVAVAILRVPRVRAALALDPGPLLKTLRRANRDSESRVAGLQALIEVSSDRCVSLASVSEATLALLASPGAAGLHWWQRLLILGAVGTPEALRGLTELVNDASSKAPDPDRFDRDFLFITASHDALWAYFEAVGRVSGASYLPHLENRTGDDLAPQPLRAVFDALLASMGDEAGSAKVAVHLTRLATERGRDLGADRVQVAVDRLEAAGLDGHIIEWSRGHRRELDPAWAHLLEPDLADYLPLLARCAADDLVAAAESGQTARRLVVNDELRRGMLVRCRRALGPDADVVLEQLGDRWPSPAALRAAVSACGLSLAESVFSQCADEVLPLLFRTAVGLLPTCVDRADEDWISPVHEVVRWCIEDAWAEDPSLVAKHLLPSLEAGPDVWRRGVALALVALRESLGTDTADALTRAAHDTAAPKLKEFLIAQRDTFARTSASRERQLHPPAERTQTALLRLLRFARQAAQGGAL